MQELRTIRLYGRLGAKFGRTFKFALDTNSPAEAISALSSQLKGFRQYLHDAKAFGIGFAVFVGKKNIEADDLGRPTTDDIRIAPILLGSKSSGLFSIIVGAALIAASFIPGVGLVTASILLKTGIGIAAGGLVQMLSPQPKALRAADSPQNQPSYVFNGSVNTQAQGNPVPLLYGRMIVGSAVVSAGISAEDYAPATGGVSGGVPLGNLKTNFYDP